MSAFRVLLRPGLADLSNSVRESLRAAGFEFDEHEDNGAFGALITLPAFVPITPYSAFDEAALKRTVEDGILGYVRSVQRALPRLPAGARIIHIAAFNDPNSPGAIGAALTEAAIIAFARSTAAEFAAMPIAVNAILPRDGGHSNDGLEAMLGFLLRSPVSVSGLALPVPCVRMTANRPA